MSAKARPPKRPGSGRTLAWPAPWLALAQAAGGAKALHTRLECGYRSLERWAAGGEVPGPARVAVRYLAAELGVRSPV